MSLIISNLGDEIITNEEAINEMDFENMEARRVLNKFCLYLGKFNTDTVYLKDDVAYLTKSLIDKGVNVNDSIKKAMYFYNSMETELLMNFLYFLNIRIKDENNLEIKKDFIKLKYFTSFIFDNVEKKMINNNFDINEIINYSDNAYTDIPIDRKDFEFIRNYYNSEIIAENINTIISVSDLDITENYPYILISESLIKSALLNINDEFMMSISSNFHDIIESKTFIEEHPYSNISEEIIINCFKRTRQDKRKVKSLTL